MTDWRPHCTLFPAPRDCDRPVPAETTHPRRSRHCTQPPVRAVSWLPGDVTGTQVAEWHLPVLCQVLDVHLTLLALARLANLQRTAALAGVTRGWVSTLLWRGTVALLFLPVLQQVIDFVIVDLHVSAVHDGRGPLCGVVSQKEKEVVHCSWNDAPVWSGGRCQRVCVGGLGSCCTYQLSVGTNSSETSSSSSSSCPSMVCVLPLPVWP